MLLKSRFVILLFGMVALIAVTYAGLPVLMAGLVERALVAQGFSEIGIEVGRPGWRGLRVHELRFQGTAGGRRFAVQTRDVAIEYRLPGLAAGTIQGVRIPAVSARIHPAPGIEAPGRTAAPLPAAALLPGHWLSLLPLQELSLDQLRVDWEETSGAVYTLSLKAEMRDAEARLEGRLDFPQPGARALQFFSATSGKTGETRLSLTGPESGDEPMLDVVLNTVSAGRSQIDLNGVLKADIETLATVIEPWLPMPEPLAGLAGDFQSQWQATLAAASSLTPAELLASVHVRGEHTLDVRTERLGRTVKTSELQLRLITELDAGIMHWQFLENSRLSTLLEALPPGPAAKKSPVVAILPSPWSGQLQLADDEIRLSVAQGAAVKLQSLDLADLSLPDMQLALSDKAVMHYAKDSRQWRSQAVALSLAVSPIVWRGNRFHNDGVALNLKQLQGDATTWRVSGEANVKGFGGRIAEYMLPVSELHAGFRSGPEQAAMQATLSTGNGAVVLKSEATHDFTGGNGRAEFSIGPVLFSESAFTLSKALGRWPYPFDITAGRLAGTGEVNWQTTAAGEPVSKQTVQLRLEDIGGHYNEITFSGLNTELALANADRYRTTQAVKLGVDRLDVGLPIENIDAVFQLAQDRDSRRPVVKVQEFKAELLGGRARSEAFELDFERGRNRLMLELEHLGLSEIMRLEQQEGLEGSGLLDGRIPIELTPEGVQVQRGKIAARAPGGTIRYKPTEAVAATAQSNTSIKLMVDALSNFQYHTLDALTDYTPDGDLTLQIKLKGSNPEWRSGQPVHLNLNLEENIPALLRSLQLADQLDREITDRVRKGFPGGR